MSDTAPIDSFLTETQRLLQRLDRAAIDRALEILLACHAGKGRVYTCGNGGSAATAQHFACDLAKFAIPPGQPPFDVRCLTDNISLYTAWANDAAREDVYVNLMRGILRRGDVLIACSVHGGKGFSADLVRAVRFANESGASTISLVGFDGGLLHQESTVSILVPAPSTPQVEAIHLVIEHLLMDLLQQRLAGAAVMNAEAICVGHASYDLCMFVNGYPAENSKAETDLLIESGGGPAANAAYLLSRWGVPTAFAGAVGDDAYGRRVIAEFERVGTQLALLTARAGHATPVSFIIVNRATGSRTIINRKVSAPPAPVSSQALAGCLPRLILFDGHEWEAALQLRELCPRAITILDAGSRRQGTEILAAKADYLVCSERFAQQITGLAGLDNDATARACLQKLRQFPNQIVVVTLGERGLVFADGDGFGQMPADRVKVADTTAAGDIFHGAFAFGLLQGLPLRKVLRLATIAAGLSVQTLGGRPSIPDRAAVLEALGHD